MSRDSAPASAGDRFSHTLNLPKTDFPQRADLARREPESLQRWEALDLYARLRRERTGEPRFVLHDGPPYANGPLHLGHLLNRCLKDFAVRAHVLEGADCPLVPGWDCHGLPVEQKVLADLAATGGLPALEALPERERRLALRRRCRAHAEESQRQQAGQARRLLALADFGRPYLTMSPDFEAGALEVLADLVERGLVYRARKPVHWSPALRTALAEAELEYQDREDLALTVGFPVEDGAALARAFGLPAPVEGAQLLCWTTTAWSLAANLAVAVHARASYALARVGGRLVVCAEARLAALGEAEVLARASGERLLGLRYRHPLRERAPVEASAAWTVLGAEHVSLEDGTGLVHTAPGHGDEDFRAGQAAGLPPYCPVREDGAFDDSAPEFLRGRSVWEVGADVAERLRQAGCLFAEAKLTHSYPHDWRLGAPTLYRAAEQWFVAVDRPLPSGETLRQAALRATDEGGVAFHPAWARKRLQGMLAARPDWCLSRQRAWGLPLPAFVAPDGRALLTPASVRAVARAFRARGSDAWFELSPAELLALGGYDLRSDAAAPAGLELASLQPGGDVLDVWFESGSSWRSVLGADAPADVYLEGSDQHRGWFQLSLLLSLATSGRAPYRALVTHGFLVDKEGRKLSKRRGDAVLGLLETSGAEVLRFWVAGLAWDRDVKVDESFVQKAGEEYRKVRNTLRFLLGNLGELAGPLPLAPAPTAPEAWLLAELDRLSAEVRAAYAAYDYARARERLLTFCAETLSARYFTLAKDRLYCDRPDSPRRRRAQAALWAVTDALCRLLAPLLPHTADEAFRALWRDGARCVHLERAAPPTGLRADPAWAAALEARAGAASALGEENPLEQGVALPDPEGLLARLDRADLADLLGVSRVELAPAGPARRLDLGAMARCERCRRRSPDARPRPSGLLCERCSASVPA